MLPRTSQRIYLFQKIGGIKQLVTRNHQLFSENLRHIQPNYKVQYQFCHEIFCEQLLIRNLWDRRHHCFSIAGCFHTHTGNVEPTTAFFQLFSKLTIQPFISSYETSACSTKIDQILHLLSSITCLQFIKEVFCSFIKGNKEMPAFIFEAKSQLSVIPCHSLYGNSMRNNKLHLPTNFYAAQTCMGLKSYTCFTTTWSEQKRCYTIRRKDYNFPELKPDDLEEEFVRGSGPGGQSVNTTSNCVVLKHIPTGIIVKCHESRSLDENRKRARLRLEEKLDLAINGDHSFLSRLKTDAENSKREKKRRNSQRLALKSAFKKREGLDESQ